MYVHLRNAALLLRTIPTPVLEYDQRRAMSRGFSTWIQLVRPRQTEKCPSVADLLARGLVATALPDDVNAVGASPVETRVRLRLLHGVDHLLDLHHAMGEMLPSLVHQLVEPLCLWESKLSECKLNFVLARTLRVSREGTDGRAQ